MRGVFHSCYKSYVILCMEGYTQELEKLELKRRAQGVRTYIVYIYSYFDLNA